MFLEHLNAPRGLNHGQTSRGAYELRVGTLEPLLSDEVRLLRDHVYAIEIALGLGPGGQVYRTARVPLLFLPSNLLLGDP
ncbi:Hypothetical protein PHPALM_19890 [Phytophthora palmivora]|uniref:Uncharacterized protein n=1 Tax=Phytophthora palmivora TaxID=4796 RepID=A0A2P4XG91_9STRA|nr:Hypothetical protein PHPALM_19890 [Phytophthora palmivora]